MGCALEVDNDQAISDSRSLRGMFALVSADRAATMAATLKRATQMSTMPETMEPAQRDERGFSSGATFRPAPSPDGLRPQGWEQAADHLPHLRWLRIKIPILFMT